METGTVIMVSKKKNNGSMDTSTVHTFRVYDEPSRKIIFEIPLTDPELIGRIKSGLFTFVGDHLYFDDDVIKIRSDLIRSVESKTFKENQIFDSYHDIFDHQNKDKSSKVQCNMPMCS
jgi:hypothetical protein